MVVSFKVFASIIVAEKKKLMLAAVFNAKCGGILGKSLIIPLNVAVSEGLPPFGVLKQNFLVNITLRTSIVSEGLPPFGVLKRNRLEQ